jgi:hypothetical protein
MTTQTDNGVFITPQNELSKEVNKLLYEKPNKERIKKKLQEFLREVLK